MAPPEVEHRLYPIGALTERQVLEILTDPLCSDRVPIDEAMSDWRLSARAFEGKPRPKLDVLPTELIPLRVSPETKSRIESVVLSYRDFLPATFDLAFVPIEKLVTPQEFVSYDPYDGSEGENGPLSDDDNAKLCLASPLPPLSVEAALIGSSKFPSFPNRFEYTFQFSSDDPNIRYIPTLPLKPVYDLNLAGPGARYPYEVKAVPIAVGLGLPFIQVLAVPMGTDPGTGATTQRLLISNGVHRAFKLAELGNTHVAALVQSLRMDDIPNPFIDFPRDFLFSERPVTIMDLTDRAVSRVFRWKKSKRVIRVQIILSQEITYVT